MIRNLSFWFLIALLAAVGLLLFQVIKPFVITIFLAIILAVLFSPTHRWLTERLSGRERIASVLVTLIVVLLVLVPIGVVLVMAGTQVMEGGKQAMAWLDQQQPGQEPTQLENTIEKMEQSQLGQRLRDLYGKLPEKQKTQLGGSASKLIESASSGVYNNTQSLFTNLFAFVIGLCITSLSLYYFLADRRLFLDEIHQTLPLEWREERELAERFQELCRGVVLGTIAAGLAQAALAGIAFAVIGVPQLWLLIVLTMFCSFIPFVGSAIVWIAVAIMLLVNQNYIAAGGLVAYGTIIIGSSDNLVRAYVIGSQSRLHPLIALITVLGAIEYIGLWGIFMGPMVAGFFYALVNITRERCDRMEKSRPDESDIPAAATSGISLDHA